MHTVHKFQRRARGQGLVEFALVMPVVLMLLLGVLEVGRVVFTMATLSHAVNEGARLATLPGTPDVDAVKDRVVEHATVVGVAEANITVTVTSVSGAARAYSSRQMGDRIKVSLEHTYQPAVSFIFGAPSLTLRRETEIMAEGKS